MSSPLQLQLQSLSSLTISSFLPPLPLVGLITSTSALAYAYCEHIFLNPLSDPSVPPATIRRVWQKCFPPGFVFVATSRIGSIASGVAGYRASGPDSVAGTLYASAIAFTVVHFAFLPWVKSSPLPKHLI
uniref:Dihydropyrimidine dehydrogenase [NADP(+)] n=1 Tax=Talaromyces marneffei PM1 TaxID=1077442 RepID=A0A093XF64_TALMA